MSAQFTIAKYDCGLKQWSKTYSAPQGISQLQKQQAARMSRRIAVEQRRYAAGMAHNQG